MTTRRARSGRPRARSAARTRGATSRASPSSAIPSIDGGGCAEQPVELLRQPVEDVALGRRELRPGGEVAHVARRHAEGVRHELGQVRRALAVEDPGHGGGQEAVGPVVEPESGPDEQELAERPRVERERDLGRDALGAVGRAAGRARRPGRGRSGRPERPRRALGEGQPARGARVPAEPELRPGGSSPAARVAGSTLAAVSRWANGLRSLPTPIRPSAQAWSGVVPRPENGSRTTSPGRE